jgi:hypothetical protein
VAARATRQDCSQQNVLLRIVGMPAFDSIARLKIRKLFKSPS